MEKVGSGYVAYSLAWGNMAGECGDLMLSDAPEDFSHTLMLVFQYFGGFFGRNEVCLAGGFVRALLEKSEGNYHDVDLFFYNRRSFYKAKRHLRQKLRENNSGVKNPDITSTLVPVVSNEGSSSNFSPKKYKSGKLDSLGQSYSLRPEKWRFCKTVDALDSRDASCLVNLVYVGDVEKQTYCYEQAANVLDQFDINAVRCAITGTAMQRLWLTAHARCIWDIANDALTFNEQCRVGMPMRRFSHVKYWDLGSFLDRLEKYTHSYKYNLDPESYIDFLSHVKRQVEKGQVKSFVHEKEELLRLLDDFSKDTETTLGAASGVFITRI